MTATLSHRRRSPTRGLALHPRDGDAQLATLDRRVLLGAVRAGVRDPGGERLAREVRLMRAGGGEQLRVAVERERDAILDREAGRLARVLHRVDDLAREPLAAQVVVEGELECDRMRALALELIALERRHRELEVLRGELVVVAVDRDADRPPLAHGARDARRVERLDR